MRQCRECFQRKPRSEFILGINSISQYCETCREGRSQGKRQADRKAKAVSDWPAEHRWHTKPWRHQDQATPRHFATYREESIKMSGLAED